MRLFTGPSSGEVGHCSVVGDTWPLVLFLESWPLVAVADHWPMLRSRLMQGPQNFGVQQSCGGAKNLVASCEALAASCGSATLYSD